VDRIDLALAEALRGERRAGGASPESGLIDGVDGADLPGGLTPQRLELPHSTAALTVNSFLPWRRACGELTLAGQTGFDAIQFDARCPTGLRGTPPQLNLLALAEPTAVGVMVHSIAYLGRQNGTLAGCYDELLATMPGAAPWRAVLEDWRAGRLYLRHVDIPALIKYVMALGRTFPNRPSTLLYVFWEPLDADAFTEFRCHRAELQQVAEATRGAGVAFAASSFDALWQGWAERGAPVWIEGHVARLRRRYGVVLGPAN
jgi:hypothetical protein